MLAPLNQSGDEEGCTRHDDGSVTTPTGFKEAYRQYCEAGWGTLSLPAEYGGQGLPHVLGFVLEEYLATANHAFAMYPGLTNGAVSAILATGSDELKADLSAQDGLRRMARHDEPDRAAMRHRSRPDPTQAEPQADGSYAITGTKIFISAGEHDLAENIIHLVLAKTPGAPESSKGISLFIVPKFLVDGRRHAGRAQCRFLRLDRAQDGHPRQCHLRDELRRRHRLAGRARRTRAWPRCSS